MPVKLDPGACRLLSFTLEIEQEGALEPGRGSPSPDAAKRWLHDEQARWETSLASVYPRIAPPLPSTTANSGSGAVNWESDRMPMFLSGPTQTRAVPLKNTSGRASR